MTRYVVCGEALIDLIPDLDAERSTISSIWDARSAGGPMNSAIALARQGQRVEFLGRLGSDRFGRQLTSHLEANNVGLKLAAETSQATSLAIVSLDSKGHATYNFHFSNTANFGWQANELPELGVNDWLHIASLVLVVPPGDAALLEWVKGGTTPMSIDVNVRPTVMPDPEEYWTKIEPWLIAVGARRGIIKGSDEDIAFLAGPARLPRLAGNAGVKLARRYGAPWVVLTLGEDGAVACNAEGDIIRVPVRPVDVVDTVGAGDTFMSGFLSAYVGDQLSLRDSLRRGVVASSIVCTRKGANPPTMEEIEALS